MDNLPKRVAIYARVSTAYQVDGDSLPYQRTELPKYAEMMLGIKDYEVFEDAGYSGKNTERPALKDMMNQIRERRFSHVLVWKIDRISRNLIDFASLYRDLKDIGVTFVSKNEQFDTSTAMGEAMLKIIMVFAELERNMTSERVSTIMKNKAGNGEFCGGHITFGYKRSEKGGLEICQEEASEVRLIFDLFLKEKNVTTIRYFLNSPEHQAVFPRKWYYSTIRSLLTNTNYIGNYVYGKRQKSNRKSTNDDLIHAEGVYDQIIPVEKFEAVQAILNDASRSSTRKVSRARRTSCILGSCIWSKDTGKRYVASATRNLKSNKYDFVYFILAVRDINGKFLSSVTEMNYLPIVLCVIRRLIAFRDRIRMDTKSDEVKQFILAPYLMNGYDIEDSVAEAICNHLKLSVYGETVYDMDPSVPRDPIESRRDEIEKNIKKYTLAMDKLNNLYLLDDAPMPQQEYIEKRREIQELINRAREELSEINLRIGRGYLVESSFTDKSSYIIVSDIMTQEEEPNIYRILETVSRKTLDDFLTSVVSRVYITDRRVSEIDFSGGLRIPLLITGPDANPFGTKLINNRWRMSYDV